MEQAAMKTNITSSRGEFWRGRTVLVTGASGFIGSWLVQALLDLEAQVVALFRHANPRSDPYRTGIIRRVAVANVALEDFWALEQVINRYETEVVFHLGAQTLVPAAHRFPLPTFEANIRGTYHLLEACRLHRSVVQRIVIASSDKAYGEQPVLPYKEEVPLAGRCPYEVSKSCADLLAQAYFHTYGLPLAIARCGNVYGGGDLHWSRLVPGVIRSLWRGERPQIRSDGTCIRDYVYVRDIIRAYLQLAEHLDDPRVVGEAFNFGAEKPLTVLEMVDQIRRLMGRTDLLPEIQDCAEGEIHSQYLSTAKARAVLGWQPVYDLETGLRETISWYRRFFEEERL